MLALLLALLFAVSVFSGCGGADGTVDTYIDGSYQIVYEEGDPYAEKAAFLFCATLRTLIGERLSVLADGSYDPDEAQGGAFYIGDTDLLSDLPALDGKDFVFASTADGIVLRAKDPFSLYLAACCITDRLETAGGATVNENGLLVDRTLCTQLNALSVNRDEMISVMSQNVRCADDGGKNDIDDRSPRLEQLIADYRPDLLGTQEVTKRWMGIFEESFGEEYGMIGCSRDGVTVASGEWNTILYKKSRFDLVEGGTFWLSATPYKVSEVYGSLCKRICTWALLLDKLTGEKVFFANTHLDHSNDNVREKQAKYLMDQLASYMSEYPTFLTGDFNTSNKNAPYKTITDKMSDAHKAAIVDESTVKGTYHNYGAQTPAEIDFCFYNDRSVALSYRILSDSYSGYVSDHYGLITHFAVK
jgi:endonuclease/exonuclease/phosphatase family metal-dependent hydrolase